MASEFNTTAELAATLIGYEHTFKTILEFWVTERTKSVEAIREEMIRSGVPLARADEYRDALIAAFHELMGGVSDAHIGTRAFRQLVEGAAVEIRTHARTETSGLVID